MTNSLCNRVYDAHIHIPIKYDKPYNRLKTEIIESNIDGGLIILNNRREAAVFFDNYDDIFSGELGFVPDIAFILDLNNPDWQTDYSRLKERGIRYSVKIHPRLTGIVKNDFKQIADCISSIDSDTVIVDNWIYGPRIESHIGTELCIYLAELFPDKKIVMAHSGGVRLLETMLITRPVKNIYYDLAETCQYFNNTSVCMDVVHFLKYTKDRIMFGSDYPDFKINYSIKMMEKKMELAELSQKDKDAVMYANAIKIYGGAIRNIVEDCDNTFIEGITQRDDYEMILQKMMRNAEVIAVKYKANIAGYASMYANNLESKVAYISLFGIKKEFQGKGLGTFLMYNCCKVAKEHGMERVLLEVLKENLAGIGFYSKYGFKEAGNCSDRSIFMGYDLVEGGNQ